ncbi:tetratricopeptide repeat protein [Fluviicola sp.]|uniref:tetratricopeptide repeat-containing sensor histidine kinase n=1 Tax=Fluviicola sp. TaxID=1917219 RepID=UPI0031DA022C
MGQYALFTIVCLLNLFVYSQSDLDPLLEKGYSELESGHLNAAKSDLEKAKKLISSHFDLQEKAILFNNLGVCYIQLGEFKKGIDHYSTSLKLYQKLGNDTLIAESLLNLGIAYKDIGAFDRATKTILNAAAIFEKQQRTKELSSAWNSIGNIQRKIGNIEKALEYHERALKLRKRINYSKGIADSYNNIGAVYLDLNQPEKAQKYLINALHLKKQLGNEWNSLTTLTLLGRSCSELNQHQQAFEYLNAAYNLRIEAGSNSKIASSLFYLGNYYSNIKDIGKAIESFRQAEKLSEAAGDYQLLKDVLSAEIKQLHLKHKEDQILIDKYKKLVLVNEMLVSEENRKEIARLEIRYDVERKEKEIRIQRKQAKINQVQLENQQLYNQQLITWLVGTIAVTLSVILAWYLLRKRKKLIEIQNEELKEQKDEISALHKELSHRTKNYFGMLSGILKSDKSSVRHPETLQVLEENIRRLEAMSLIQHYLLDDSARKNKEVRLDAYFNNLVDLLLLNLLPHNHAVKLFKNLSTVYLDYDIAIRLGIVLNELVCNAIEHGLEDNANPELHISMTSDPQTIRLTVKDNGSGLPEDFPNSSNAKGLKLIRKLLHKINGTIDITNENGCKVSVIIKL